MRLAVALLALGAVAIAGCGGREPRGGARPAAAGAPRGVALAPAFRPDSTPEQPPAPAEPTARYASLEAARDSVELLVRRVAAALSVADSAIHLGRARGPFEYRYSKPDARGLVVSLQVNAPIECPDTNVEEALRAAGWVEDGSYAADGDDGSVMGFVCRQFLCVVEARWEGGDPTDTTYVPRPGCRVSATLVPRRADDVPPDR
jgi:hypothetical protein